MKATLGTPIALAVWLCLFGVPLTKGSSLPGVVVAWGDNASGQLDIPTGLTNAVAIAGGGNHSLALKVDGSVVAWGDNSSGQTNVPASLSNVIAVAGGYAHSMALKSDGTVMAWGNNSSGPGQTNVPVGLTNVIAIAAGWAHSLALKLDGTVIAWGQNYYGQSTVPAGLSNVVAIAGGSGHSLALKSDGTVIAWGEYYNGAALVPMFVPTGLTNAKAIACFSGTETRSFNLSMRTNGTLSAWGNNNYGQTNPPSGLSNAASIAAGFDYGLALKSDGTLVAWGNNTSGQASPPAYLTNIVVITAGSSHGLAITVAPVVSTGLPSAISLAPGTSTNLEIFILSGSPFGCHWNLNGLPIAGATGNTFTVENFDITKAGVYSVTISNQFGLTTARSNLRLINSPVVIVDGFDVGGGSEARIDSAQLAMTNTGSGEAIYFTLDGSAPDFTDIPYTGPFTLTNSATIRAIAYNAAYTDSAEAAPINVQIAPTYPLTASTPGGGSVGVSPAAYSGGNRYVSNTVVTLTATPASGWSFLHWTGDSTATTSVTTVLMDRPRTVQAVFGTSLNLFTNGNGQLGLNPATGPYAFGSTVQLTAWPAPGAYFFGWAGAAGGFSNPLFITVTNAAGLTALFGTLNANQVSLTVLPNGNGMVSVSPGRNVYTNGESVTLTAWPGANQRFTNWSGDASGNLNPLPLTLTASQVITANFVPGAPTNPPVITQPPLSRTLSAGANTLLSFALTGDGPFAYQWRLNQSPLSGATNPTLLLTGVTPAHAGRYEVVVTGPGGAVTSAPASVGLFGLQWVLGGGGLQPLLVLDGAPGASFRLEHSWNLSPTNWSLLAPVTLDGSRLYFVDGLDTNRFMRFYRAVPE